MPTKQLKIVSYVRISIFKELIYHNTDEQKIDNVTKFRY